MIEGAIFDLDGTILDSMHLWDCIASRYLRSLGIEPRDDIDKTFKNFTLEEGAAYLRKEYNVQMTSREIIDDVNHWVEQAYFEEVLEKNGLREFLEALKKQNVKMCIATLTELYQVEAALKRLDLYGYFEAIYSSAEEGVSKREPYIFRKAMAMMGTTKEKTVVFEDAAYALQTAKTEGLITCGIYDVHCKEPEKVRKLSDIFLESYTDTAAFWQFVQSV